MVPIYSVLSFLSLTAVKVSVVFDVPRDMYESYVIYNFLVSFQATRRGGGGGG
jgi:hypothetical protein